MRNKLALIIALASFAVVTALGVGMAGRGLGRRTRRAATALAPTLGAPPASRRPARTESTTMATAWSNGRPRLQDPNDTSEEPEAGRPPAHRRSRPRRPNDPAQPAPARSSRLDAGRAEARRAGGVTHNESLGGPAAAATASGGGVTAPQATAGVQPPDRRRRRRLAVRQRRRPHRANPTTTIAPFGPAPIGVPNFVIDSFEIPPFLLPIYQACGTEYGIPWEVLASINKIETGFGTNLNVSSAGAIGWMQFLPSSWETYGLDANGDGRKDPYNPVDAICAAAHYLKIAGGDQDLYNAIFSYNHADWYVQEVLLYARAYGKLPTDLVGSLTGLTEGAHFPVAANARYADEISARAALKRGDAGQRETTATPPK